jgi:hypothetical protein
MAELDRIALRFGDLVRLFLQSHRLQTYRILPSLAIQGDEALRTEFSPLLAPSPPRRGMLIPLLLSLSSILGFIPRSMIKPRPTSHHPGRRSPSTIYH